MVRARRCTGPGFVNSELLCKVVLGEGPGPREGSHQAGYGYRVGRMARRLSGIHFPPLFLNVTPGSADIRPSAVSTVLYHSLKHIMSMIIITTIIRK